MYEKPKLNRVGDAQDVILGIVPTGSDIDGNWLPGGMNTFTDDSYGAESDD
jgi:hypothetical protein